MMELKGQSIVLTKNDEKYYELYDELVDICEDIKDYYDIDKIKGDSVYIWDKKHIDDSENLFDIHEDEIVYYTKHSHVIVEAALPIIGKIQDKLKEIGKMQTYKELEGILEMCKAARDNTLCNISDGIPATKTIRKTEPLYDSSITSIMSFVEENNINPDEAYVSSGYDMGSDVELEYEAVVDLTDDDILKYVKQRYRTRYFKYLKRMALSTGYRMTTPRSTRSFKDLIDIYDAREDDENMVKYFNIYFNNKGE